MKKNIMTYEDFSNQNKVDHILDKINKYGIDSITKTEKEFLDALKNDSKADLSDNTIIEEGYFRFEFEKEVEDGEEIQLIGTLYVPDLTTDSGYEVKGDLKGRIIVFDNGSYSLEFTKTVNGVEYDVFDFCEGIEYELDNFIDQVIQELE